MQRQATHMLMMIIVLALLAVVPMGVLAQDDAIVIDFYYPAAIGGLGQEDLDRYVADFMEANPGITVNASYQGSYTQTRDVVNTEAPDLIVDVAVLLAIDLYSFIEEGYLVPAQQFIDEMEDGEGYVADFFPAFLENSTDEEGTIWAIPYQRSTPILYYNADLLAAEGIEVPKNNEELLTAAQALTTEDRLGLLVPVAGTFPIWIVESFLDAYGQPLTRPDDPTTVNLDTPEALAAVEYITKLGTEYGVGPEGGAAWGDTPTAFIAEEAAMIYHTTGSLTRILNEAPFEVGTAFLPSGPAGEDGTGYGAPTGGGNLYIFDDGSKSEEELEAAWLWVQYLSSPEVQSDWGAATGYIAARQSAWDLEPLASVVEESPQYAVARDQLEYAEAEFASYRTITVQGIINSVLSSIISGETSLEDAPAALAEGQAQIDGLLEEYR